MASLLLSGAASAQDGAAARPEGSGALSLLDGRFVFGPPISKKGDHLVVHFKHGDVDVPLSQVRDWFSTTVTGEDYEPKDDDEKAKLAKGLIPFNGQWMSRSSAERQVTRMMEKRQEAIEEQKERREWRNAKEVKTRYFDYKHNLPDETFDKFRDLVDVFYETFLSYWKLRPTRKEKCQIYLYSNRLDFEQLSGAGPGVLGFYVPNNHTMHYYLDRSDIDFTIAILFHELNHVMVGMTSGRFDYPDWLEESLAEFYGASRYNPDAKNKKDKLTMGHLQAARLMVVQSEAKRDEWVTLKSMIEKPDFAAREYAWGWTFVHYLLTNPKYCDNFKKLYKDLAHGRGIKRVPSPFGGGKVTIEPDYAKEILCKRLGVESLDKLEEEWKEYLQKLEVQDLQGLEQAATYPLYFGRAQAKAREMLEKAVSMGAKLSKTYATYAKLLDRKSEKEKALEMIDRAIAIDPLEPPYYYAKAKLLDRVKGKAARKDILRTLQLAEEMDPEDLEILTEIEVQKILLEREQGAAAGSGG
ncbi:MAG: DUF1570 domain-containing protein [Planctomycetota bacterium]